jgi:hypothetical protein
VLILFHTWPTPTRAIYNNMAPLLDLIAICGGRGSGKDTIGYHLCRQHKYIRALFADPLKAMVQAAFGFSDEQIEGHGRTSSSTNSRSQDVPSLDPVPNAQSCNISRSRVLQFVGTEVMQHHIQERLSSDDEGPTCFWSKRLVQRYVESGIYSHVVVTDLRFMHEWHALKQAVDAVGGRMHVWRVVRPWVDTSSSLSLDGVAMNGIGIGAGLGVDALPPAGTELSSTTSDDDTSDTEWRHVPADIIIHNTGSLDDLYAYVDAVLLSRSSLFLPSSYARASQ